MIVHIVFFKLHPEAEGRAAAANAAEIKSRLEALPARIPQLRFLQVGHDVLQTPASYDVALVTHFDSLQDLEAYRVHPEHQAVVGFIQKVVAARAVVDYETP